MNSWKAFSASCWLWKSFPCKKWSRCLKKLWLVRGQVNTADEAKLGNPILSTFETLVVWLAVGHCCGELGPFCWPILAAGIAVLVYLIDFLSILLRCNGFTRIQKVVVDQTGSKPSNSDHDPFFNLPQMKLYQWYFNLSQRKRKVAYKTESNFSLVTFNVTFSALLWFKKQIFILKIWKAQRYKKENLIITILPSILTINNGLMGASLVAQLVKNLPECGSSGFDPCIGKTP